MTSSSFSWSLYFIQISRPNSDWCNVLVFRWEVSPGLIVICNIVVLPVVLVWSPVPGVVFPPRPRTLSTHTKYIHTAHNLIGLLSIPPILTVSRCLDLHCVAIFVIPLLTKPPPVQSQQLQTDISVNITHVGACWFDVYKKRKHNFLIIWQYAVIKLLVEFPDMISWAAARYLSG